MTLGNRIVRLRRQMNLNQKQLAERLGVVSRQLVRWENDQARPRPKALIQLAKVLEVPVEELVAEAPEFIGEVADSELRDLLEQVAELSPTKVEALKVVLRDMITCEQITKVTSRNQKLAS